MFPAQGRVEYPAESAADPDPVVTQVFRVTVSNYPQAAKTFSTAWEDRIGSHSRDRSAEEQYKNKLVHVDSR